MSSLAPALSCDADAPLTVGHGAFFAPQVRLLDAAGGTRRVAKEALLPAGARLLLPRAVCEHAGADNAGTAARGTGTFPCAATCGLQSGSESALQACREPVCLKSCTVRHLVLQRLS